jgi:LPS-assembly lipoprotein
MWLSKHLILILILASVTGCSFKPAFKSNGVAKELRGNIEFDIPADRNTYKLVSKLEENFNRSNSPTYKLGVSLAQSSKGLGGFGNISRYNLMGTASFNLRSIETGEILLEDKVSTFTSYSASSQTLATETAARAAQERLMRALANKITSSIIMNFNFKK